MAFCSVRVMRCWPMTSSKVWGRQRRETEIWDTAVTSGKVNRSLIRQESGAACQKPDGVMPEFPPFALIYYAGSALAAIWVLVDGRTRLAHRPAWEVFVWSIGTALALPVFLPMYMLGARAPDRSAQWGPVEMIGIAIFFGLTMPLVAGLAAVSEEALPLRVVSVVILVQNAGFVLLSLLGIALRYPLPLARLGLTTRRWAAMLLVGLIAGAVMIPVASVTEQAGVEIYALLRGRQAAERQAERERKLDPLNRILATTKGPGGATWPVARPRG